MSTTARPLHEAAPDEEQLELFFIVKPQNSEDELLLFRSLQEVRSLLGEEIAGLVPTLLGPLFRLEKIDVRRGSVVFLVYIAGAFTLISQYDDFVRSLGRLRDEIQAILYRALTRFSGVNITSGLKPLKPRRRRFPSFPIFHDSKDLITLLMASYLILSHGFMLVVLVRIAVKAFLFPK